MTDEAIVTSPAEGEASAPSAPAAPAIDAEAIKAQLKAELEADFEKRAAGFQRALNEKEAALRAAQERAREVEMSGMTQDERDALEWQQTQDELDKLRQENALLALATEYPDEIGPFRQILAASDPKQQLDLIRALRQAQAQAAAQSQPPAAEPETEIPPVDLNNPPAMSSFDSVTPTFNGQQINEEWADRVLAQFRGPTRT